MKNGKKTKKSMITAISVTAGLAIILILALVISKILPLNGISDSDVVATVNGVPIQYGELRIQMDKDRAGIAQYFNQKYGTTDQKNFWNQAIHGEIPIEKLKETALTDMIKIKEQQVVAQKYGVVKYIDYTHFVSDLKAENNRRTAAVKNNQVVYGPVQYDEMSYYNYVFSNTLINLKDALWSKVYKANDTVLKQYYEKIKSTFYRQPDTIKVMLYSVSLTDIGKGKTTADLTSEMKTWRSEKMNAHDISAHVQETVKTFDPSTFSFDSKYQPELLGKAESVKIGQFSDVFTFNNAVCFLQVVSVKSNGYKNFNDVKIYVTRKYKDEQYDAFIKKAQSQSKVVTYKDMLKKISS